MTLSRFVYTYAREKVYINTNNYIACDNNNKKNLLCIQPCDLINQINIDTGIKYVQKYANDHVCANITCA